MEEEISLEEGIIDEQPVPMHSRPVSSTSAPDETTNSRPGSVNNEGLQSR